MEKLRTKIRERYGTVRRFAGKVGYTESMLSKMLHGTRKIYPDSRDRFATLLEIPKDDYKVYFGEETWAD